ncbi:forkhead box protein P3 isoform X1 [Microcaecilia unicolor]|uniref:Forkhead box protein P3-like isoform X1 n=1 Tax=Microcaecilia unicolor TaxID=1415580 RepID=A0A6P7XGU6_9AMPH|nr:forkhead box protein P3-like isoform X1 [Microcaecilia unicolor]
METQDSALMLVMQARGADSTVSIPGRKKRAALSPKSLTPEPQFICLVEGKKQKGQHDKLQSRATVVTSSSTAASRPQQLSHPLVTVAAAEFLSTSPHLQALLQENQQWKQETALRQQVSSDTGSRPSVLHMTSLPHPTPVTPKPPRIFPVKVEPPQLHVLPQGINLTDLEWIQKEASKTAPRQSVLSRSTTAAASSACFSLSPAPAESYRVPAEVRGKSPMAGCQTISSTLNKKRERHLHSDHRLDDKGTAQCLIQKEVVENLEQQLALEKIKLHSMQTELAGRLNTNRLCFTKSTEQSERSMFFNPRSTTVSTLPAVHASLTNQDGILESFCSVRRHLWGCQHGSSLLPDMAHSVEYYKVNNVRPPFTYASLISWAILETPEKQLTLSEIYHWFTRRFAYFRHNTATWKNAVRHNLSLHKCFVRVENMKGAVWTVDEVEYQRKRGAKLSRDQEMKRFLSSQLCATNIWPSTSLSPR